MTAHAERNAIEDAGDAVTIGVNLAHDAGCARISPRGIELVEMERVVGQRHACGGAPGVSSALRDTLGRWLGGRTDVPIGIVDYASPFASDLPAEVRDEAASASWEVIGTPAPHQLVRPLAVGELFGRSWPEGQVCLVRHHWAHAMLAYRASPLQDGETLVVCLDSNGCFADSGLIALGEHGTLTPLSILSNATGPRFGLVYQALAQRLFANPFDTGKLLGLAAYGQRCPAWEPVFHLLLASNRCRTANPLLFDPIDEALVAQTALRYGDVWYPYDPEAGGYIEPFCRSYKEYLDALGSRFPDAVKIGESVVELEIGAGPGHRTARDTARTLQVVLEDALVRFFAGLSRAFPDVESACYAGNCALNISANTRILTETRFKHLFVPSCCDDSGVAMGAALAVASLPPVTQTSPGAQVVSAASSTKPSASVASVMANPPALWPMSAESACICHKDACACNDADMVLAFAGAPLFIRDEAGSAEAEVRERIAAGARLSVEQWPLSRLIERVADLLVRGVALGWIEGRCETGPRALGHRSIFADPRRESARRLVSELIKGREAFRPVAPMCLLEEAREYFEGPASASPTMLLSYRVRPRYRRRLAAITHVDGTARLQTVSASAAPRVHALLCAFKARSGVSVLINTSLNGRGRPIANSVGTVLDILESTELGAVAFVDEGLLCIKSATRARGAHTV